MSLHSCLDWLSAQRKHLRERGFAQSPEFDLIDDLYQRLELIEQHYTMPRKAAESASLDDKRNKVSEELGKLLLDFKKKLEDFEIKYPESKYLKSIRLNVLNDLETIKQGIEPPWVNHLLQQLKETLDSPGISGEPLKINEALYKKYQAPPYLIASISQSTMPELGNSKGACYGFTLSMLDPEIDPYRQENKGKEIILTPDVYERQKNYLHREKDQGAIKRSRLTRTIFCPDATSRACELYDFALKHPDTHLYVMVVQSDAAHACYLNVQNDGKIRYMDPNSGAYLFNNKEEFIECYKAIAEHTKIPYLFYQVSKLDDKQDTESLTIRGKIRSFLTGNKYDKSYENPNAPYRMNNVRGGALLGAVIDDVVGNVIQFVGWAVGTVIGGSVGRAIVSVTQKDHPIYPGILGPFQTLQEERYRMEHPELFNLEKSVAVDSRSSAQRRVPEDSRRKVGESESNGFAQGARAAPCSSSHSASDGSLDDPKQRALKANMENLRPTASKEAQGDMPESTCGKEGPY